SGAGVLGGVHEPGLHHPMAADRGSRVVLPLSPGALRPRRPRGRGAAAAPAGAGRFGGARRPDRGPHGPEAAGGPGMSVAALRRWIAERVPIPIEALRQPLREELPVHLKSWLIWLGGTPLILFGIQAVTGILLTFYYSPNPDHAYDSVRRISTSLRFGWLVRSVHQTGAQLM